jgi:hypothetical protein
LVVTKARGPPATSGGLKVRIRSIALRTLF